MKSWLRPVAWGLALSSAFLVYTTLRSGSPLLAPLRQHLGLSPEVTITEAAPQNQFTPAEMTNIRIYQQVRPSVVNITSQIIQYDLLFGAVPASGQGSGFIINPDGYILTNYHVIRGAQRLTVTWTPSRNQSRQFPAEVVGTAPELDLAVIRIQAKHLPAVTLGDSANLQVGQKVLAIGNPFGLPGTMTQGIISSIRTVRDPGAGVNIDNAIQTDAPINPGNSGGPLLNSQGQVIGINSAIYSETGSYSGIGFALPINVAKAVLKDLITTGRVQRPSLGIEGFPLSPSIAEQLNLPVSSGLLVLQVRPGSAAAKAGVQVGNEPGFIGNTPVRFGGDILVAIDGAPVGSTGDIARELITKHSGDKVTLTIYRGDRKLHLTAVLQNQKRFM